MIPQHVMDPDLSSRNQSCSSLSKKTRSLFLHPSPLSDEGDASPARLRLQILFQQRQVQSLLKTLLRLSSTTHATARLASLAARVCRCRTAWRPPCKRTPTSTR